MSKQPSPADSQLESGRVGEGSRAIELTKAGMNVEREKHVVAWWMLLHSHVELNCEAIFMDWHSPAGGWHLA